MSISARISSDAFRVHAEKHHWRVLEALRRGTQHRVQHSWQSRTACLAIQRMKAFKKTHPHPSVKMDGQANRRIQDCQSACPDAEIPTLVEADGVRLASQNIPRTEP